MRQIRPGASRADPEASAVLRRPKGLRLPYFAASFLDVDRDRRAESLLRTVQVVANLEREPMLAGRELHVDDVLAIAEVHPWRRPRDHCSGREAVCIDCDVVVAEIGPALGDGARRDRRNLIVLYAELQTDRAFHRRAVLWLNEEHSRPWRF